MKRIKQVIVPTLLLFCLVMGTISVSAADDRLGTVVDGSLLTDETEAESIAYPKARGAYFSYGTGSVTIVGTRSVKLTGSTAAYQSVDQISVAIFLQRLVGDNWQHVLTMGPKIGYNTNYVSNSNTYSVAGGYYYRASGQHIVIEGSTKESKPTYSNGVWVP